MMVNKLFKSILLGTSILISMTGCSQTQGTTGNQNIIARDVVTTDPFTKIEVVGSPDVVYKQTTGAPRIQIQGTSERVEALDVYVANNTLIVKYKDGLKLRWGKRDKLEARVAARDVNDFSVSGSGDIHLVGKVETGKVVNLKVTGSGDIDADNIVAKDLRLFVTGSGDINVKETRSASVLSSVTGSGDIAVAGKTENANFKVSGSGDIKATALEAQRVDATVTGSGDITCHAVRELTGKTTGSGNIGYKGTPSVNSPIKGLHKIN